MTPSRSERWDVLVAGGGLAGMTAAAAFHALGRTVICVDPAEPVTERDEDGADHRSTALLQPSRDLMDEIGVWPGLAGAATALAVMRIHDQDPADAPPALSRDFVADEIGAAAFGWNLANWRIRAALADDLARRQEAGGLVHATGVAVRTVTARSREALVGLDDGRAVRAKLVVAADGRNSVVRQSAGIGVRTIRYGQKALAFAVTHPIPHGNVSTEIYDGGPFTLVPLPDLDGAPSSAVVWMQDGRAAERHMAMDRGDFEAAISARSGHALGPLTLASDRTIWPIVSQVAHRFHAERVALVAEAAHVMPPIGAQGLNTSLADIRKLRDLARTAPEDLGGAAMLSAYSRARMPDVAARLLAVDALNRATRSRLAPVRTLRRAALQALHGPRPVRRTLMRAGLGATG